jgi:shikimate kinase
MKRESSEGGETPAVCNADAVSGHLVLVGLMGSGKSTVGTPLASRLGRAFVDNDALLERHAGVAARELQETHGADALHRAEADMLLGALQGDVPAVIAAAAAAVLERDVPAELRHHSVVYLRADPDTLARRVTSTPGEHRPLGGRAPRDVLREQFAARDEAYRALATFVVDASQPADEIVDAIVTALAL